MVRMRVWIKLADPLVPASWQTARWPTNCPCSCSWLGQRSGSTSGNEIISNAIWLAVGRQLNKQTGREVERQRDKETGRQTCRETERQRY